MKFVLGPPKTIVDQQGRPWDYLYDFSSAKIQESDNVNLSQSFRVEEVPKLSSDIRRIGQCLANVVIFTILVPFKLL